MEHNTQEKVRQSGSSPQLPRRGTCLSRNKVSPRVSSSREKQQTGTAELAPSESHSYCKLQNQPGVYSKSDSFHTASYTWRRNSVLCLPYCQRMFSEAPFKEGLTMWDQTQKSYKVIENSQGKTIMDRKWARHSSCEKLKLGLERAQALLSKKRSQAPRVWLWQAAGLKVLVWNTVVCWNSWSAAYSSTDQKSDCCPVYHPEQWCALLWQLPRLRMNAQGAHGGTSQTHRP